MMTEEILSGAYDASDPVAVKKAEKAAKQKAEERRQVVIAMLSSIQGREWLWQFLTDCHTFNKRLAMSGDAHENGYFEGEREVGLRLMRALCGADPVNFAQMLKENDA